MHHFIDKIFTKQSGPKSKSNMITIYLDAQCKRSIEVNNQNVESYIREAQFENDQFLYMSVKNRKTKETVMRRKLLGFQNLEECLANMTNEQYKAYIIVGYNTERNTVPKINSIASLTETLKFIRSGTLQKYSQNKNLFEECHLKLHHDYLTYYKLRSKQKKVSFMPLENASVEMIHDKKHMFIVKDKFKSIMFRTTSKEDMIGWLLAINEAIKVRNAQIYMNQLDEKLNKKIKDKLTIYCNRCSGLRDNNRTMLLDQIGRKALRQYFRKNQENKEDIKMLTLIETYLYMCKVRREKGEQESEPIIASIKQVLEEMREFLPATVKDKDFSSKQDLVKAIEEIMRLLDEKYKKILIEKKYLHSAFQSYIIDQYKENSRIPLKSLFGEEIKN